MSRKISRAKVQKSCVYKVFNRFKGLDMYGESIQLTYNGENKYTTYAGGVLTIVFYVVMFLYISYSLQYLVSD